MKEVAPLVAICMVTFNSGHVLERCLKSLHNAVSVAGISAELSCVDNGSNDDSVEKLRALWPEARIIQNDTNIGYARAINQAVLSSRGEWILLINPDTVVPPDLFVMLKYVHSLAPGINVFSPVLTNEAGNPIRTAYRWPSLGKELVRLFGMAHLLDRFVRYSGKPIPATGKLELGEPLGEAYIVDYAAGACLFIRRVTWTHVGPFDEEFLLYHEEMEWCWRAYLSGIRVFVLPACQVVHLVRQSSRHRPVEEELWRYRGLLHFYEKHRPRSQGIALRAAIVITYGVRTVLAALRGQQRATIYSKIVQSAIHTRANLSPPVP